MPVSGEPASAPAFQGGWKVLSPDLGLHPRSFPVSRN
jgi:hypothetical protein